MRFFSVLDILQHIANEKGDTRDALQGFFKARGVRKADLEALQGTSAIPDDPRVLSAVTEYTGFSALELSLALGLVPSGYEDRFFGAVKDIARLLQEGHTPRNQTPSLDKPEPYFETTWGSLYKGDCLDLFRWVQDSSVDCVFADPPFNLNKAYDEVVDDNKAFSEYLDWCVRWLDESARVLKPGGCLFIYNIPKWHTYLASYLNSNLRFWDWIAVDMKFNLPLNNRLYPAHYSLLCYVKGTKPRIFHNQRLPLQTCRHCGGEIRDYGGYKDKMNPAGVNVSDVWTDIYPVRHRSSKTRRYNELPVKLLDRVITMSTDEGDMVLDPFGGSGSTYAVCELLGRRWTGFEIGDCENIKSRLLNKDNDKELLAKVYEEKNRLFPDAVAALRRKNGFWLPKDFRVTETAASVGLPMPDPSQDAKPRRD
jgi:site-specific DNA-methyltransferase (adenine-specific)